MNRTPPSGFPELNLEQQRMRQHWLACIRETFEMHGFPLIDTPLVERAHNLLEKGGNPKEIYALKRLHDDTPHTSEGNVLMRFDHTVPLALFVTRHMNEIRFPFKRGVIGPVFRGERAQKGRFRQFDQCDIDVVGSEKLSLWNDAEIASVPIRIFTTLMPHETFVLHVSNRKMLTGYFRPFGLDEAKLVALLRQLDGLSATEWEDEQAWARLTEPALSKPARSFFKLCNRVHHLSEQRANADYPESFWHELRDQSDGDEYRQGVAELRQLWEYLVALNLHSHCAINLRIARGLDYYSGTVYETQLRSRPELGSICSGGRYDNLVGSFGRYHLPGVGISMGLSRLLFDQFTHNQTESFQHQTPSRLISVGFDHSDLAVRALAAAQTLREMGFNCDISEHNKFSQALKRAQNYRIPLMAWLQAGTDPIVFLHTRTSNRIQIAEPLLRQRFADVQKMVTSLDQPQADFESLKALFYSNQS